MMQVCVNNNNLNEQWTPKAVRPKRDFRFQVIEVRQGPKWFVWPSRNRGRVVDNDENHNEQAKTVDTTYSTPTSFPTVVPSTAAAPQATQNGYGCIRRSLARISQRRKDDDSSSLPSTPSPSTSVPLTPDTAPTRKLSVKKEKAMTEPLSISAPSSTFQILSICKKWDSFDATDDELDDSLEHLHIHNEIDRRWSAQ